MKSKSGIKKDTLYIASYSIILQGLGLLLNLYITKSLGTEAVGICSLIYSLYSFAIVFANGNIFTSTSRFVSEEIGKGCGNVERIMKYALTFSITLSLIVSGIIFVFSEKIGTEHMNGPASVVAIKMIAFSLPLATIGACIKGYFHARRMVSKPCISDAIEFISKAVIVFAGAEFLVKRYNTGIFSVIALSLLAGELISCIYLVISYASEKEICCVKNASINSIWKYISKISPIILNGYIFAILSGGNDIIVPVMLKNYSGSTGTALSEYGIFEGIIMPVMFFPSIILQSLSLILVPEFAREKSAENSLRIKYLVKKTLKEAFAWSILVASVLFAFGHEIGNLFCDDKLAGDALVILCPVIPFIYLEIVLEGILKGLGKQNFSTINSAVEYVLRISAVLIFTQKIGFYGIIASYFISNIVCDIIRMIVVLKETGVRFDFINFLLTPIISSCISFFAVKFFTKALPAHNSVMYLIISILMTVIVFIITKGLFELIKNTLFKSKKVI